MRTLSVGHGFNLLVTEKHVLLRLLVAKTLAIASIFPARLSVRASPTGVAALRYYQLYLVKVN